MIDEIILKQYQDMKKDYKVKVKLTYFKNSGKYYSEGVYMEDYIPLFKIWDRVKNMDIHPELNSKWKGLILVEVSDHINEHPHFVITE